MLPAQIGREPFPKVEVGVFPNQTAVGLNVKRQDGGYTHARLTADEARALGWALLRHAASLGWSE